MKQIQIGIKNEITTVVTQQMLALSVGSGDVNVYATPMMVALMEKSAAACIADYLDEGETSVGTRINTTHVAATPCQMKVLAKCKVVSIDRKKIGFLVEAYDERGLIGTGEHDRIVVNKHKFEERATENFTTN